MRREWVNEGWSVQGRVTGAGQADVQGETALPFRLEGFASACGREGLFLRGWDLARVLQRPAEPEHSHAERTLLTLDGVRGAGVLLVDGRERCALQPRMEVDVSEEMRAGQCHVLLRFAPHLPVLWPGERGRDLPVETAVWSAQVRNVYLLRIEGVEFAQGCVRVHIYAYGSGKVRVCFRLLDGEQLVWSENDQAVVRVGSQVLERPFAPDSPPRFALMRVTIDMGGEGCDEICVPYATLTPEPRYFAHFCALPGEEMLRAVRQAGFDGVHLPQPVPASLRESCCKLGLHLEEEKQPPRLCMLLRADQETRLPQPEECLAAPMLEEGPAAEFAQAQKLCRAVARLRAEGKPVHMLALGRQRDAQDGLFGPEGQPRCALFALRGVMGRVSLFVPGPWPVCYPYADFSAPVQLFVREPNGAAAVVCVLLYLWDGTPLAERSFAVSLAQPVQTVGPLEVRLPWNLNGGLMLRVQCWRGGVLVAQNHAYYPCAGEDGKKQPFPLADVTEGIEGGARVAYNASDAVAAGVTVACGGKILLRHGALLPQERIELARRGEVVVKYGNPIEKGGASIVSHRVLRGIFPDSNPPPADTQAGHR